MWLRFDHAHGAEFAGAISQDARQLTVHFQAVVARHAAERTHLTRIIARPRCPECMLLASLDKVEAIIPKNKIPDLKTDIEVLICMRNSAQARDAV